MGKSVWSDYQFLMSMYHDRPGAYIDPRGDTFKLTLATLAGTSWGRKLWEARKDRIVIIDPVAPSDYVTAFDPLDLQKNYHYAQVDPIALLANSITTHAKKLLGWNDPGVAQRMEAIMLGSIGLLAGKYTLAEMPALYYQTYTDSKPDAFNPFTRELLAECNHPGTRDFFKYQWANWSVTDRKSFANSTENQLTKYLFDRNARLTMCAQKTKTISFQEIIDRRMWLLVNLPYQFLGETVTSIIGSLIIDLLFLAAMQRNPTHDYRITIDEAGLVYLTDFETHPQHLAPVSALAHSDRSVARPDVPERQRRR